MDIDRETMETARQMRAAGMEEMIRRYTETFGGDVSQMELVETRVGNETMWYCRRRKSPPEALDLSDLMAPDHIDLPLVFDDNREGWEGSIAVWEDGETQAPLVVTGDMEGGTWKEIAIAHLFAASPELYAACRSLNYDLPEIAEMAWSIRHILNQIDLPSDIAQRLDNLVGRIRMTAITRLEDVRPALAKASPYGGPKPTVSAVVDEYRKAADAGRGLRDILRTSSSWEDVYRKIAKPTPEQTREMERLGLQFQAYTHKSDPYSEMAAATGMSRDEVKHRTFAAMYGNVPQPLPDDVWRPATSRPFDETPATPSDLSQIRNMVAMCLGQPAADAVEALVNTMLAHATTSEDDASIAPAAHQTAQEAREALTSSNTLPTTPRASQAFSGRYRRGDTYTPIVTWKDWFDVQPWAKRYAIWQIAGTHPPTDMAADVLERLLGFCGISSETEWIKAELVALEMEERLTALRAEYQKATSDMWARYRAYNAACGVTGDGTDVPDSYVGQGA